MDFFSFTQIFSAYISIFLTINKNKAFGANICKKKYAVLI
jgi:hypothetical protein